MADFVRQVEAYRQFASSVAERLMWVFAVDGSERGTGKEARAVLRAIRDDLRIVRLVVEFPELDTRDTQMALQARQPPQAGPPSPPGGPQAGPPPGPPSPSPGRPMGPPPEGV